MVQEQVEICAGS